MWETYRVAIITYRKNVKDLWDENLFNSIEKQTINGVVSMHLCEAGTLLNGHWFREVRKLSFHGHQTAIITTHPTLSMEQIALKMFSRWTQENFFKYVVENFDFDRMIEYGTEPVDQTRTIPNPEYKVITYRLKKENEKKTRLKARMFKEIESGNEINNEHLAQIIFKSETLWNK